MKRTLHVFDGSTVLVCLPNYKPKEKRKNRNKEETDCSVLIKAFKKLVCCSQDERPEFVRDEEAIVLEKSVRANAKDVIKARMEEQEEEEIVKSKEMVKVRCYSYTELARRLSKVETRVMGKNRTTDL